jgi:hypothetical protein
MTVRIVSTAGTFVLAAVLMLGLAAAGNAPAAHRSYSMPKIQTFSPEGWHGRGWLIAPTAVYFGGGASYAAPRVKDIRWSWYGHGSAFGYAKWWLDYCKPSCVAGGHWVNARVYFYRPFDHAGPGWNFSHVRVHWRRVRSWSAYINGHGWWIWR